MPTPANTNAGTMSTYGVPGVSKSPSHSNPAAWSSQAGHHQSLAPPTLDQNPDDRGEDHDDAGPRQDAETRAQGRVALDRLEELREEEDGTEHAEAEEHGGDVHRGEGAVAEQAEGQHRVARPQLPPYERGQPDGADGERREHFGTGPAVGVPLRPGRRPRRRARR